MLDSPEHERPQAAVVGLDGKRPTDRRAVRRALTAWCLLATVLLWAALAMPFFLGRTYLADDLLAFHLPLRQFYAECLRSGEAFDWIPDLFGGFYLTGEGQVGVRHPLHLLLYRHLPLPGAFGLELLLTYPLLFVGTALWLRRRMAWPAACWGAMTFAFGSFNLLHLVHPHAVAVAAHLPWLLWAIDVFWRSPEPRLRCWLALLIAALTGSQILLGYPQYVWFSLLAEAGYLAWLWREGSRTEPRTGLASGCVFSSLALLGTAKATGLALGAVQLLPTFDFLRDSQRSLAGAEFFAQGGLHPLNLLQPIGPYLFRDRVAGGNTHELGFYLGAAPLLTLVWLAARWKHLRHSRNLALGVLLLAGLFLWMALGQYGGWSWVQQQLPLVGKFRLPCRQIVLVQLFLAAAAAVGWADLFALSWNNRRRRRGQRSDSTVLPKLRDDALPAECVPLAAIWRIVGLSAVFALLAPLMWGETNVGPWYLRLAGPLLLSAAAALMARAAHGRTWALAALFLFTAFDLGLYGGTYAFWNGSWPISLAIDTVPAPPSSEDRIATELRSPSDNSPRFGNQGLLGGWRQIDGYAGLEPASQLDYRQPEALRAAGVRWVYLSLATSAAADWPEAAGDRRWRDLGLPAPRVRLISDARHSARPADDLPAIDVHPAALLAQPLVAPLPAGPPGTARLTLDRPGLIDVDTHSEHPRLLVLNERFHHGWRAAVDGQPVEVLRINGDFQGCLVPAGRHQVQFEFAPRSLAWGKAISNATFAGLSLATLALAASTLRDDRKKRQQLKRTQR